MVPRSNEFGLMRGGGGYYLEEFQTKKKMKTGYPGSVKWEKGTQKEGVVRYHCCVNQFQFSRAPSTCHMPTGAAPCGRVVPLMADSREGELDSGIEPGLGLTRHAKNL